MELPDPQEKSASRGLDQQTALADQYDGASPSAIGRGKKALASGRSIGKASHPTFLAEEEELASEVIHAEGIGQCMSLRDVIPRAEDIKQVSSDILGEQIIPSSITVPRAWPHAFM